MGKKISVANLIMLAGGVVTLLFSFFHFESNGGFGFNAWDTDFGAFATTIPAILAIAMIAWCVCELLGVKLPANVLTFNAAQLKATWGISAAGTMLAWLTAVNNSAIGFWLMLIGSLAMGAGSVMGLLGMGTEMVTLPAGHSTADATPPPPPPSGGMTPPPPPPPSA